MTALPQPGSRVSAEASLRAAIQMYAAVCDLVQAGRDLVGPSDTEAPLIEDARLAVVAWLDACIAWGATEAELDLICAEEARDV